MKDFLGKEIEVGDVVVYPSRGGSSMWMNKGVVVWAYENADCTYKVLRLMVEATHHNFGKYHTPRTIRCVERVAVVEKKEKVTV